MRWIALLAAKDEGLPSVLPASGPGQKFTLRDAREELKAELAGQELMTNSAS